MWSDLPVFISDTNQRIRRITYTVRKGDSLSRISAQFRVSVAELLQWNDISPERYLQPGQQLIVFVDVTEAKYVGDAAKGRQGGTISQAGDIVWAFSMVNELSWSAWPVTDPSPGGIARALKSQGAELAFNYQSEKLCGRVQRMAAELQSEIVLPLDVTEDAPNRGFLRGAGESLGWLGHPGAFHRLCFRPTSWAGRYVDVINRDGFNTAHEVSSYSFAALAKAGRPDDAGTAGRTADPEFTSAPYARCPVTTLWALQKPVWRPT